MGKQRRANIARAEAGIVFRDGKLVRKDDWLKQHRPDEARYQSLLAEVGIKPPWWFACRTLQQKISILESILEARKQKAAPAVASGSPSQGA